MYWSFKDLPKEYKVKGTKLWAFDYATNNTEKSKALKASPYRCEFGGWSGDEVNYSDHCYKVKNNGERSSAHVSCGARHYALTKDEAFLGYNELVDIVVGFLIRMAKVYEQDKFLIINDID